MKTLKEISKLVKSIDTEAEITAFLRELLTESEIETLTKRWRILEMLKEGCTQREIAKELQVSLCKVTRGAKIMKDNKSILAKYLLKEKI